MVEPSFLLGSMFYLWLLSIVLVSSLEQWFNFENVSVNLRLWGLELIASVSQFGQGFLYTHIISKTGLVFNLFDR